MEQIEFVNDGLPAKTLGWLAAIFVALCCIVANIFSVGFTRNMIEIFNGLGVELPLATRLLIATYSWLLPLLFVGAAIFSIAKEFLRRETRKRLVSTGITFVVVVGCVGLVYFLLHLPLLISAQKLAK